MQEKIWWVELLGEHKILKRILNTEDSHVEISIESADEYVTIPYTISEMIHDEIIIYARQRYIEIDEELAKLEKQTKKGEE